MGTEVLTTRSSRHPLLARLQKSLIGRLHLELAQLSIEVGPESCGVTLGHRGLLQGDLVSAPNGEMGPGGSSPQVNPVVDALIATSVTQPRPPNRRPAGRPFPYACLA